MADLRSNSDAADIIESEGLGYAVQCYCRGESFRDPETARLWSAGRASLDALVNYLEKQLGRDDIA